MTGLTPIADALQERVLDVINDVLSEHGGGIVHGYLLVVDFLDTTGEPALAVTVPPDQRIGQTAGLAMLAKVHTERDILTTLNSED